MKGEGRANDTSTPVSIGLRTPTELPRCCKARSNAAVIVVLPIVVSVPVIKSVLLSIAECT
jgi:hypothetical protein